MGIMASRALQLAVPIQLQSAIERPRHDQFRILRRKLRRIFKGYRVVIAEVRALQPFARRHSPKPAGKGAWATLWAALIEDLSQRNSAIVATQAQDRRPGWLPRPSDRRTTGIWNERRLRPLAAPKRLTLSRGVRHVAKYANPVPSR